MRIKYQFIFCFLFFSGFGLRYDAGQVNQWVIDKNCSLKVSGKTNINEFNCVLTNYVGSDTLSCQLNTGGALKLRGSLSLDVNDFDCRDKMMTYDLRKSLQHKKFPKMTIKFLSLSKYPDFHRESDNLRGLVSIELAGITKQFEVDYIFTPNGDSTAKLVGRQKINFSDFNITPPQKLNGLIRAGNELHVEFNLSFRII